MKISCSGNIILPIFSCICYCTCFSQLVPEKFQQLIASHQHINKTAVLEFYSSTQFQTAWISPANQPNQRSFMDALQHAGNIGLVESDYQYHFISTLRNGTTRLQTAADSLEAELRITDAAIHFYSDVAYGNISPPLGYNGLKYKPGCHAIPSLLADHIIHKKLDSLLIFLTPTLPEIAALSNKLKWFLELTADSLFREVRIGVARVAENNSQLIYKLYQLGIIDSLPKKMTAPMLKEKLKEAQLQFNLFNDGVPRSTLLEQLNVPITVRIKQLQVSLNYYRWLFCLLKNESVIVVNLPAAQMNVYQQQEVKLSMRMVVGKKTTPTPTLTSRVNEVILYPYWHVPHSIATKELLPLIKRNPGYINEGNYQVLNKTGNIVDPYSLNWHSFSKAYFPYLIRQSTGCDNALGLLKLNFYNPFGVYLHDTPMKSYFMLNKRFFSHGCMRMENPFELGHLILKYNAVAIDTLDQKGCLLNQSPIVVAADEQMPVVVWYNPAGIDTSGRVLFYEDVYGKFDWMKRK